MKKTPKTDMDYVVYYAVNLKQNNSLFKDQKMMIESQMHSSEELFRNMFGTGEIFKINARRYLKKVGIV